MIRSTYKFAVFVTAALSLSAICSQARISIDSFILQSVDGRSREISPGEEFEVGVEITNRDAGLVTYVVRTTEPLDREEAPPPFDFYEQARRFAFVSEDGQVQLSDGGPHDLEPERHKFRMRLSTAGWKPGRYQLGIFAHNSTDKKHGAYEGDMANFSVIVEDERVRLVDRENPSPTRIRHCGFHPPAVAAGEETVLSVSVTRSGLTGLRVRTPKPVAPEDVLPGFEYDPDTRLATLSCGDGELVAAGGPLDSNPEPDAVDIKVQTQGMTPGLYFLTVEAITEQGWPDSRHIALRVRDPADRLNVTVSEPWIVREGSSAGRFTRLPDGRLIYGDRVSTDNGWTWQRPEGGGIGGGSPMLNDGRVITLGYRQLPIEGQPGWYQSTLRSSRDAGNTVRRRRSRMFVPQAKAAMGHAPHPGPLSTGSFVQREDGSLLALMMGWFEGDDALCPYGRGRPYSRTYVCESFDGGRIWSYLSTIGYDEIGSEGYNEGAIEMLPDGDIVAVIRTGNMADRAWQDNPVMVSRSSDGGVTWEEPWRSGVNGCYPDVAHLSDGMLVMSAGRPGAYVQFSSDGGRTWHDLTLVDAAYHSGYTALIETQPGEILVAFSEGYMRRGIENHVRMAYVRYEVKSGDYQPIEIDE